MNKQIIDKILKAAVRAPSGDNVQPWHLEVSENHTRIKLYNLPEKDDSYYNYNQMASFIAQGAVIENIMIASSHLGCSGELILFPDDSNENYVAQIDFKSTDERPDDLYQAIFERNTNRFQFKRELLSTEVLDKLSNAVKDIDNTSITLVDQKDKVDHLSKVLMVNDRLVFEIKNIHAFLFDKIRWNTKQIEETLDGMPVETMGLSFMEKLFFPLMQYWWYVKTANYVGLSRIIALKSWWNLKNSSMLGMISVKGNDKFAFVQGGRAVQRLWLETTSQGFSLQPIIGLTLLINRLKLDQLNEFTEGHKQLVDQAARVLPGLFNMNESETLIMGFRVGKQTPPSVKTKRKPVTVE